MDKDDELKSYLYDMHHPLPQFFERRYIMNVS